MSRLSASFDEFWNHPLAIPAAALLSKRRATAKVQGESGDLARQHPHALGDLQTDGVDYGLALASGEPYAGMLSGRLPLEWAQAQVLSDSPGKRAVVSGSAAGRLLMPAVLDAARAAQSEILIVTPYFVPAEDELQLFAELRARQVRIRVLTNSMESSHALLPHSGYVPYRAALLAQGVEIYEVRSLLSSARGSGQTPHISTFGTYALHAKLYVFDSRRLFIGSMNFDQRSRYLNTEVGLMIESPLLARQTEERFAAMSQAQNSYVLALRSRAAGSAPALVWQTREAGQMVDYWQEPARHPWDRAVVRVLSWLPIAGEL